MLLVRYILIFLIVYLLVRGFIRSFYLEDKPPRRPAGPHDEKPKKRISKDVGEFIDYEEIK
jgi:hypothetical protein